MIILQLGKYKKAGTKKEKMEDKKTAAAATADAGSSKEEKKEPMPALDEESQAQRIEKAGRVFKRFSSLLNKQEEVLLQKLIHNDTMHIDTALETDTLMMKQLYSLFFAWKTETDEKAEKEAAQAVIDMPEELKQEKIKQELEDKKKKEDFEREQALIDFEE